MDVRRRHWSVIQGETLVRTSVSLRDLAASSAEADMVLLAQRMREIDLPPMLSEHPMAQLTKCAQAARTIVSEPRHLLSDRQIEVIATTYEAGLLAGYDGISPPVLEDAAGLREPDLAEISMLGQRHGKTVGERWRRYQRLVSALMRSETS